MSYYLHYKAAQQLTKAKSINIYYFQSVYRDTMADYRACQATCEHRKALGFVHGAGAETEDSFIHYFGCLKLDQERENFMKALPGNGRSRNRILEETERIDKLRSLFKAQGSSTRSGKLFIEYQRSLLQWRSNSRLHHLTPSVPTSAGSGTTNLRQLEDEVIFEDLKAKAIYFKRQPNQKFPSPFSHQGLDGTFPNQKVPMKALLEANKQTNPLMWDCDNMIRYFHIPANNMSWIEVRSDQRRFCEPHANC